MFVSEVERRVLTCDIVSSSTGLEQTRVLAQEYVDKAIQAISPFPDSEAKAGLIEMCTKVMKRRK
jgi:hexaprenyl-diphosphate synthase